MAEYEGRTDTEIVEKWWQSEFDAFIDTIWNALNASNEDYSDESRQKYDVTNPSYKEGPDSFLKQQAPELCIYVTDDCGICFDPINKSYKAGISNEIEGDVRKKQIIKNSLEDSEYEGEFPTISS